MGPPSRDEPYPELAQRALGQEVHLEIGDPLEVGVDGNDREVALQGRGGNQGVDVADETWAVGLAKLAANLRVALDDRIGEEVGVDLTKQRA